METPRTPGGGDPFRLDRFVEAQEAVYAKVVTELKDGRKRSHWMWFVFPQIDGLGFSSTTRFYSIKSLDEARQYLAHPVLGPRLRECSETLLGIEGRSVGEIFGDPDDAKLRSSMTLFDVVAGPDSVFARVIDRYFEGERDPATLRLVQRL